MKTIKHTPYPLTIIHDRYGGVYSGGKFTAWPLYANKLPHGYEGCDVSCATFWDNYDEPVGKGETPQTAINDLMRKLNNKI